MDFWLQETAKQTVFADKSPTLTDAWLSGWSIRLIVGRSEFDSLADSDQKDFQSWYSFVYIKSCFSINLHVIWPSQCILFETPSKSIAPPLLSHDRKIKIGTNKQTIILIKFQH